MLATKIATSLMAAVATVAGCATDTPDGPSGGALSAREAADLAWMREEEKLARDVYDALDGYGQPFANVQTSEQRHFDAVGGLLDAYGLADPAAGNGVGVFTDPDLQALHDALVARGAPTALAAFEVGCAIEELDLRDLDVAAAATNPDRVRRAGPRLAQPPARVLRHAGRRGWHLRPGVSRSRRVRRGRHLGARVGALTARRAAGCPPEPRRPAGAPAA